MQAAIRDTRLQCGICYQYLSERPQEPMKSHEIPNRPWSKVSAAIFQLAESNYLVMVDHYSDFFELDYLRNTTASTVIRATKRILARHGRIPDECITDNGEQFDSHEYSSFAREYGFTMIKSSPYYSWANGKAGSAVVFVCFLLALKRGKVLHNAVIIFIRTLSCNDNYMQSHLIMKQLHALTS